MQPWTFPVALDPSRAEPLPLQIARAIVNDIRRGRLPHGARLPGSRTLARELGVHRNTVLTALRELKAEGWLEAGDRAIRVAAALPEVHPRLGRKPAARARAAGFELPPAAEQAPLPPSARGLLDLGSGLPDPRLVPVEVLSRALRTVLRGREPGLAYGDPMGEPRLREALAPLLREVRGLACGPESLLVTAGSLMGLDLVCRVLVRPGDRVAVEDPGYPMARRVLRAAGAELVPIPVDAEGLVVEALEQAGPLRLVVVTPHHQFPTTVTMSATRRARLLAWARDHRTAVLEDDYDFEFHFEGRPVGPLASHDPSGQVIYLGTLSKILAPGLRLGFATGPAPMIRAMAEARSRLDLHGSRPLEAAVALLVREGELQRHVRKVRRAYAARREALLGLLARELDGVLEPRPASGGLGLWTRIAPGISPETWSTRARKQGVHVLPGSTYAFDGKSIPYLRLGFGALDEEEQVEAVRRLRGCLKR